jgi:hypothetical protein
MAQGLFTPLSDRLKFRFLKELPGRLLPPLAENSRSNPKSDPCQLVTYLRRGSFPNLPCESLFYFYHFSFTGATIFIWALQRSMIQTLYCFYDITTTDSTFASRLVWLSARPQFSDWAELLSRSGTFEE